MYMYILKSPFSTSSEGKEQNLSSIDKNLWQKANSTDGKHCQSRESISRVRRSNKTFKELT